MRKLIDFFISLYLLPLRLSNRLALYVKGRILTYDEHYVVALDIIRNYFPGDRGIVIDIGAYDADSTFFLGKQLVNNTILGFEPNPIPYQAGLKRIKDLPNIELHNIGFSDKAGEVDLHVTKNLVSSSLFPVNENNEVSVDRLIKAKVDTLDSFFKRYENILLIKLDVQGAELNILTSGIETLKKTKLVLTEVSITEMYRGGCLYFELDEFLRQNGFIIHTQISNYNNEGTKYFDIVYINSTFQ